MMSCCVAAREEPESLANTHEYMLFRWHLLMLLSRSAELFNDLVSCIHGLVAVLASLPISPLFGFVMDFLNYDSFSAVSCYLF